MPVLRARIILADAAGGEEHVSEALYHVDELDRSEIDIRAMHFVQSRILVRVARSTRP